MVGLLRRRLNPPWQRRSLWKITGPAGPPALLTQFGVSGAVAQVEQDQRGWRLFLVGVDEHQGGRGESRAGCRPDQGQ